MIKTALYICPELSCHNSRNSRRKSQDRISKDGVEVKHTGIVPRRAVGFVQSSLTEGFDHFLKAIFV
jgi:hypothetical protein